NGILLAANLDALFDRFLITFQDDGQMLILDRVSPDCRDLLGLPASLRSELRTDEREFLAKHRELFRQRASAKPPAA
ncbi:MAG TPA: HNH endonuclease signature motif containing protein, partial [Stellaceae bacterium]|nr:HNH endonuclease signature motif containing protein [Stellaceae bacterium]